MTEDILREVCKDNSDACVKTIVPLIVTEWLRDDGRMYISRGIK